MKNTNTNTYENSITKLKASLEEARLLNEKLLKLTKTNRTSTIIVNDTIVDKVFKLSLSIGIFTTISYMIALILN